jgi:Pentapeptide repeats (8 copies)
VTGANFTGAELTGADFTGAQLQDASFAGASGVPSDVQERLNSAGRCRSRAVAAHGLVVFVSIPSSCSQAQRDLCGRVEAILRGEGLAIERMLPAQYASQNVLSTIQARLSKCAGAVVLGLNAGTPSAGTAALGTALWAHVEAGMAYSCQLPLLMLREPGVAAGVFAAAGEGRRVHTLDLAIEMDNDAMLQVIKPWLADLRTGAAASGPKARAGSIRDIRISCV